MILSLGLPLKYLFGMGELDLILFAHLILLELEYVNIHNFLIYNRI